MAFKNIQGNIKNSLLDYFVSGKAVQYHSAEFGYFSPTFDAISATGGTETSTFVAPDGNTYKAHVFTTSSNPGFVVSAVPGTSEGKVYYLVIGGGGGGGDTGGNSSGGGGAGGFRTNWPGTPGNHTTTQDFIVTAQNYQITVGGGGGGNASGTNSLFGPPTSPTTITSAGGGAGGSGS